MDIYYTIPEVAKKLQIPVRRLNRIVNSGTLETIMYRNDVLVNMNDLINSLPKEYREDYKRFEHLANSPIGVREASRKYNIPNQTISRWYTKGYIKLLSIDGQKKYLSEQDVAYCAEIYHSNDGKQGKWLMDKNGVPYIPKSE
jgi:predicted site-specific integrase-resolvase